MRHLASSLDRTNRATESLASPVAQGSIWYRSSMGEAKFQRFADWKPMDRSKPDLNDTLAYVHETSRRGKNSWQSPNDVSLPNLVNSQRFVCYLFSLLLAALWRPLHGYTHTPVVAVSWHLKKVQKLQHMKPVMTISLHSDVRCTKKFKQVLSLRWRDIVELVKVANK